MTEVFIQGFLGRDAAVRETEKGGKFLSFTVCSNDFVAGKQKEQWFHTWAFAHIQSHKVLTNRLNFQNI